MRRNLKKIVTIILGVMLDIYLVFAFTAFNKPDETTNVYTKVSIDIADEAQNGFINATEIRDRLEKHKLYPLEKPLKYVDVRKIEDMLKAGPFINATECYKTQNGHVNISITQRMLIIRIRSINGDDYYLDDKDAIMPNSSYTSDLIIATGYISKWFATHYVSALSKALMSNELWKDQIEQIHVLSDRGIELVPRVGDYVIYLGQLPISNDRAKRLSLIESFTKKKLTCLEEFYKYDPSQAGWNKYSYISLGFDNQIICKRRNS